MTFLRPYLAAVHYFTGLPVSAGLANWAGLDGETPPARAAHFPGVGWLVGLVACVVFAVLGLAVHASAFTPLVAAVACLAATIAMTGAMHENAWAAQFDVSSPDPETRPATRPVLALVLGVMARLALLAVLAAHSPAAVLAALFLGHVVSRFWPLVLVRTLRFTGAGGADRDTLGDGIDNRSLGIAGAWCALPLALVMWGQGLAFVVAGALLSGLAMLAMRQWLARRGDGLTRDGFVASQLACEMAFYLGAAAGLR